jgi:heme a synthase
MPNMIDSNSQKFSPKTRTICFWLLFVVAAIFLMAVVGAVTRLTESGLSIMEWAPIKGTLPPLSQVEWERVFALYKTIPEYKWDNPDMTLAEFKTIFWWEWAHRLLGRVIGLIYVVPMAMFWMKGWLPGWIKKHLLIALFLGGAQGLLGWYMVASGFGDRTDVSQYRLAAHLGLALILLSYLLWLYLNIKHGRVLSLKIDSKSKAYSLAALVAISVTVASGAFVAGLNAGVIYNTFPLMGGEILPIDYVTGRGFFADIFENPTAVQWNHRWLAIGTTILVTLGWFRQSSSLNRDQRIQSWMHLGSWVWCQAALGVTTLLLIVPIWAGALHQAGAIILLILGIRCFYFENLPDGSDSNSHKL